MLTGHCWRAAFVLHGLRLSASRAIIARANISANTTSTTFRHNHASSRARLFIIVQSRRLSTSPASRAGPPSPLKYQPRHATPRTTETVKSRTDPTSSRWSAYLAPNLTLSFGRTLFEWFKFGITLYIIVHIITTFYTIKWTFGPSMLPTIAWDNDMVLISNFFHRRGRNISVGDVISFEHPVRPGARSIKRVIGMPGDIVCRDTPDKGKGWLIQVPEGCCWVTGDNLSASRDSRMFGPLPLALVRGKVLAAWTWGKWPRLMKGLDDAEGLEL